MISEILVHCSTSAVPSLQLHAILPHVLEIALLPRVLVSADDNCFVVAPQEHDWVRDDALGEEEGLKP